MVFLFWWKLLENFLQFYSIWYANRSNETETVIWRWRKNKDRFSVLLVDENECAFVWSSVSFCSGETVIRIHRSVIEVQGIKDTPRLDVFFSSALWFEWNCSFYNNRIRKGNEKSNEVNELEYGVKALLLFLRMIKNNKQTNTRRTWNRRNKRANPICTMKSIVLAIFDVCFGTDPFSVVCARTLALVYSRPLSLYRPLVHINTVHYARDCVLVA